MMCDGWIKLLLHKHELTCTVASIPSESNLANAVKGASGVYTVRKLVAIIAAQTAFINICLQKGTILAKGKRTLAALTAVQTFL